MQSGDWERTGAQLFSQELQLTLKAGHLMLLSKVYILGGWGRYALGHTSSSMTGGPHQSDGQCPGSFFL